MGTLLLILVCVAVAVVLLGRISNRGGSGRTGAGQVSDAEAEARRWIDRLGHGVLTLDAGDSKPARQALADAAERHSSAEAQLSRANTPTQYAIATQTALEGLYYIRAARTALGLDPGPELPASDAGRIASDRRVRVGGQDYAASPDGDDRTPYYYPGGRGTPAGWYSRPWWKSALATGAGVAGGIVLADVLIDGVLGPGGGFGGFGGGDFGGNVGGDFGGGDGGFGGELF